MDPTHTLAIAGGGNLCHGTIAAVGAFNPKYSIRVISRRPENWGTEIEGLTTKSSWEHMGTLTGKIEACSADPKDVIPGANIVLLCSPAHTKVETLQMIKPYIQKGAMVGSIFGQGGFDLQCIYALGRDFIEEMNLTIFCLQYVPFLCKVKEYGKQVLFIGPKKHLYVASYPVERVEKVCVTLS